MLGVDDGLVSTLAVLLGVAGAGSDGPAVRVAGLASLIAGACSLAVSQYIADQTLGERRGRVANELRGIDALDAPARSAILQKELVQRGIAASSARVIGAALVADSSKSSAALGLLRYGFNARDRASPLRSAFTTLTASAAGAIVPILPWFFASGETAIVASVSLSSLAAIVIGALIGSRSSGAWRFGAFRQLGLVLAAAAVTYEVGRLLAIANNFAR